MRRAFIAVLIQYRRVTDTQPATLPQQRPRLHTSIWRVIK